MDENKRQEIKKEITHRNVLALADKCATLSKRLEDVEIHCAKLEKLLVQVVQSNNRIEQQQMVSMAKALGNGATAGNA